MTELPKKGFCELLIFLIRFRLKPVVVNKQISLAFFLLIAFIVFFGFLENKGYLGPGDNTTYANIARNIADGNGIAHNTTTIPQLLNHGGIPKNDFEQPIGWPIILSGFFIMMGSYSFVPIAATIVFHIIGLFLVYLIARRLYNINEITVVSMILYSLSYPLLKMASSGLSEPLYTVILLLIFYLAIKPSNKINLFLIGTLFAYGIFVRSIMLFAFIGYALYVIYDYKKYRKLIIYFYVGFFLALSPFLIRNLITQPIGWSAFPGQYLLIAMLGENGYSLFERSINLQQFEYLNETSFISHLIDNIDFYSISFFNNIFNYVTNYLSDSGIPWIILLGVVYFFNIKRFKEDLSIKIVFFFLFSVNLIGSCMYLYEPRYIVPYLPVILIFASVEIYFFINRFNIKPRSKYSIITIILFVLLLKTPAYFFNKSFSDNNNIESYRNLEEIVHKHFDSQDLLISNNNAILGWNGNVRAASFPILPHNVLIIDSLYTDIDGIYLDSEGMKRWEIEPTDKWMHILNTEPDLLLNKYKLVEKYEEGDFKYLLYKTASISDLSNY
jgi:hypothetical protein